VSVVPQNVSTLVACKKARQVLLAGTIQKGEMKMEKLSNPLIQAKEVFFDFGCLETKIVMAAFPSMDYKDDAETERIHGEVKKLMHEVELLVFEMCGDEQLDAHLEKLWGRFVADGKFSRV
jgi:hypothetical protein